MEGNTKEVRLQVRMTKEEKRRARVAAREDGFAEVSAWLRHIVNQRYSRQVVRHHENEYAG
jgi:adenosylcobinamide amidohydrolase